MVKITDASIRGDAYARANTAPESPDAWVIVAPLAVRQVGCGSYDYVLPANVHRFESICEAREWKRRRVRFQKARRRTAAHIRIMRVDAARLPLRVLEGL